MPAFYAQVSKQFGEFRPFFRYQYINAHPRQFACGHCFTPRTLVWPSLRFNDNVALKAQLDHTFRKGLPDLNGLHLQLAFTFEYGKTANQARGRSSCDLHCRERRRSRVFSTDSRT